MNILYMHSHDCGRFISPYGYDMPTPNMLQFAREGAVFRQACSASPTCSPSRAALLTGQYGHVNGMMGLAWKSDGFELKDYGHHLVQFLKKQNYLCAIAGIHHISRSLKSKIGYDRVLNRGTHWSYETTPESEVDEGVSIDLRPEDAARRFLSEKHEQPFFLSVGFGAPHRSGRDSPKFSRRAPYRSPDSEESKYSRPLPIYPDNPVSRSETANFKEGTKILDDEFGDVLNALNDSPYADNTLVILTTDHGAGMPGMKCTLTEWGIGVFLMMRGPGIPKGAVLDGLVSHVDIFPTIADYIGAERPDWVQGKSLVPMLQGEKDEVNDYIFAEQGYHGRYCPLRAVRNQRYKLIRSFGQSQSEDYYFCDGGPMHMFWMEHGYDKRFTPEYALYDLMFDPMERCNQAGNPAYQAIFNEMKERLDLYMQETNDPLLQGELGPSPALLGG